MSEVSFLSLRRDLAMNIPGREAVLASVLRNLSRSETPMRYVTVQRIRAFLYKLSDVQYELFMRQLFELDPYQIDPKVKDAILADIRKRDETGAIVELARTALESHELIAAAKQILLGMVTE